MSVQSAITAMKTLISGAGLGLVTVEDGQAYGDPALPNPILPEAAPALLIFGPDTSIQRRLTEHRKAGTASFGKWREFSLYLNLWAFYADAYTSAATFRALHDSVVATIRATPRLGGAADTATAQLIFSGELMTEGEDPWRTVVDAGLSSGEVGIVRHSVITVDCKELTLA